MQKSFCQNNLKQAQPTLVYFLLSAEASEEFSAFQLWFELLYAAAMEHNY